MQWQRDVSEIIIGRKCIDKNGNMIDIYFLLLLTQVDFLGATFYFLKSTNFENYFYFLESRVLGKYFYFLQSTKLIYFWQHCQ